jgi:hypothetical protein
MRRLIFMLAAGLLAAGTAATSTGVASAGTATAHHRARCASGNFFHVTNNGVDYYLGTPTNLTAGSAAILKPRQASTTAWAECAFNGSDNSFVLENRGLALTSRATTSGEDVTLTPPGNGGNGFASQRWIGNAAGPMITFRNVKTGLFLRVRNSGPVMHQTVTTGSTFTIWLMF